MPEVFAVVRSQAGRRWQLNGRSVTRHAPRAGAGLSQFEFVLVVVAIVAGFSISAILAGWGRHLLAPPEMRPSGLQYLASLVLLFQTIRYVWVLWDFRAMDWLFLSFFQARSRCRHRSRG